MIQTLTIGPITVHFYGLILGTAIALCWYLAEGFIREVKESVTQFDRTVGWVILWGIIGARFYHVIDYRSYYAIHPGDIFYLWQGGLGIYGAIGGGLIALWWLCRKNQQRLFLYLDSIALTLPLGQAIGRWGNWVNYELYGKPTTLPWGWYIPEQFRPENMLHVATYHPLFLYESLLLVSLFLLLRRMKRRLSLGSGRIVGVYLMGYGLIRFILEPLRLTSWKMVGIPVAWWMSIIVFGIGYYWFRRCRIRI